MTDNINNDEPIKPVEGEEISFKIVTGEDDADLIDNADKIVTPAWPEFMLKDPIANKYWSDLYDLFPAYQFAVVNAENDQMVAAANSIPLHYEGNLEDLPDEGWDWAVEKGVMDHKAGLKPNLLCALQIVIQVDHQDMGFSPVVVDIMRGLADKEKLLSLIAPVRPMLKSQYPLISIEDYITWTNADGEPFDPWLRVHARLGAALIKPCGQAMDIRGSVSDWEKWTDLSFQQSGRYTVAGALQPLEIDLQNDTGRYIEPNVWMGHPLR